MIRTARVSRCLFRRGSPAASRSLQRSPHLTPKDGFWEGFFALCLTRTDFSLLKNFWEMSQDHVLVTLCRKMGDFGCPEQCYLRALWVPLSRIWLAHRLGQQRHFLDRVSSTQSAWGAMRGSLQARLASSCKPHQVEANKNRSWTFTTLHVSCPNTITNHNRTDFPSRGRIARTCHRNKRDVHSEFANSKRKH